MSYAEVEQLLGRSLPPSAMGEFARQWWANTETHSQGRAWLRAGWKVWKLDPKGKEVEFRKATGGDQDESGGSPSLELDGELRLDRRRLDASAVRMLEDLAEEQGLDLSRAAEELLNRAALNRRKQLLDWFAANTLTSPVPSAALVREERDGR